jgi:hypothetical protein
MIRRLVFCLAMSFMLPAFGAELLQSVASRLSNAPVIRGQFEQSKQVAGFRNPLVSRGDFVQARERGVVWRTRQPFASTLVVTRDSIVMRGADGNVQQQVSASAQPAMRVVSDTVLAVLRGDVARLSERFKVEGELKGGAAWRLALSPADATLRRAFVRIEIEGDRFVRQVSLQEAGGDTTTIRMVQPTAAETLTKDEAHDFE